MAFYNDSKFNMWRACIGAMWIDGNLDPREEKWITEKIENLKFTDEQREILRNDLKGKINFEEVLSKITDKKDRAFLAHQMRVIGHLDDVFSSKERELYEKWNKLVLGAVDLGELEGLVAIMERESYSESEVYKEDNRHSVFEKTHRAIQKLVNPGDYKFPKDE